MCFVVFISANHQVVSIYKTLSAMNITLKTRQRIFINIQGRECKKMSVDSTNFSPLNALVAVLKLNTSNFKLAHFSLQEINAH